MRARLTERLKCFTWMCWNVFKKAHRSLGPAFSASKYTHAENTFKCLKQAVPDLFARTDRKIVFFLLDPPLTSIFVSLLCNSEWMNIYWLNRLCFLYQDLKIYFFRKRVSLRCTVIKDTARNLFITKLINYENSTTRAPSCDFGSRFLLSILAVQIHKYSFLLIQAVMVLAVVVPFLIYKQF